MPDLDRLQRAVLNYVVTVDELYGHYLDTTAGFLANARLVAEAQDKARASVPPGQNLDDLALFYGHGDPNDPSNRLLYKTTQGMYKSRNAKGGHNHIRAAQLLLVLVFEYWESEHRTQIAAALGLPDRSDLKAPLLGDLRLLRQDVIHHQGVVREESLKKMTVLRGIVAGEQLQLTDERIEQLIREVKGTLDALVVSAGGSDPEHRKVWHVQ